MSKKLIIIAVVILIGLIGILVLSKGGGGLSLSSSPGATIKAFYKALDNGDLSKAEEYLHPFKASLERLTASPEKFLPLLAGKIQKVEILEEEIIENSFARVKFKASVKPGTMEEVRSIANSQKMFTGFTFIQGFSEDGNTFELQKYKGEWKISYLP